VETLEFGNVVYRETVPARVLVRRLCHNGELPFHYGDRNFRRFTYAQSSELETQLAELMLKKKGGVGPHFRGQEFQCYRVGSHRPHHNWLDLVGRTTCAKDVHRQD